MHKHSKEALRQLAAQIGDITHPAAKALAKQLESLISQAWKEGQNEKATVETRLAEITRLDEQAIAETASAISEERLATFAAEQEAHCAVCQKEFAADVATLHEEMARVQNWMAKNGEGIGTVTSIRIIFFGDVEFEEGAQAIFRGVWNHLTGADEDNHTEYESYHVLSYCDRQPDGHNKMYICVFDEEQYRRFTGATKLKSPTELAAKGPDDFKAMIRKNPQ